MRNSSYIVLAILLVLSVIQAVVYYTLLPEQVASHFRPDGTPDGFSSKGSYLVTLVVVNLVTALVMCGSAKLLHRIPNSLINVPHKDFWLAEERRSESLAYVEGALVFMAATTVLLFMGIAHLTLVAHQNNNQVPPTWLGSLIAAYILMVMAATIAILMRFGRPPDNDA